MTRLGYEWRSLRARRALLTWLSADTRVLPQKRGWRPFFREMGRAFHYSRGIFIFSALPRSSLPYLSDFFVCERPQMHARAELFSRLDILPSLRAYLNDFNDSPRTINRGFTDEFYTRDLDTCHRDNRRHFRADVKVC